MQKRHLIIINLVLCFCLHNTAVIAINTSQQPEYQNYFDNDFKERYTGRKYDYEGKDIVGYTPSGNGEIEDYKKGEHRVKEKNNQDVFYVNLGPLSWLLVLVLIIAVGYLAYVLLNEGGSGLFSNRQQQKLNENGDITAENIESTDIQSLINMAENSNDYRLAIRYYYLLVLKNLSLKKLIKFEEDKTNADYLNEISAQPFVKKFSYISYIYNYTWYGEFDINTEQYNRAKTDFTNLLNLLK